MLVQSAVGFTTLRRTVSRLRQLRALGADTMPAKALLRMNRVLQRVFAHGGSIVWNRPGGPAEGHHLKAWFDTTSAAVDVDGFQVIAAKPRVMIFLADIYAIDPSRRDYKQSEVFWNNGGDTVTVDGRRHRIESCTPQGFDRVEVGLEEF